MNPWLNIASAVIPEVPAMVQAIIALFKKYPGLTPDQLNAAVLSEAKAAGLTFDANEAAIAADQAAHPA